MKYTNLQNEKVAFLTERICSLDRSLSDLKDSIRKARSELGAEIIEHELAIRKIEALKNSLFTLLAQKEKEESEKVEANNLLDVSRFDSFRDDRGLSVESLPVGPLAIVPLGNTGGMPPHVKWTDIDAPNVAQDNKNIILKECNKHGVFSKGHIAGSVNGILICTNCNTEQQICGECESEKKRNT